MESVLPTILVADDAPADIGILSEELERQNFSVRVVTSGAMVVETIQSAAPDLILLSIRLPDMDGYAVCHWLKSQMEFASIPVIFLIPYNATDDRVRIFQAGGVDYITKPLRLLEAITRINSHITLINQQRALQQRLQHEVEYLERLNNVKVELIRSTTHDLRNPMTSILLAVEALRLEKSRSGEKRQQLFMDIEQAVGRMQELLKHVVDTARLETGFALDLQRTNLNVLLNDCVQSFSAIAAERKQTIEFHQPNQSIVALVDAVLLHEAVDNLLANALKYSPPESRIAVNLAKQGKVISVQITDSGLGIPPEDIPNLFERFHRVQRPEHLAVEGTGVGLATVKSIVEQHHGEVRVDSELGKGSTFTITLPQPEPIRVLLVDDDTNIHKLVNELVKATEEVRLVGQLTDGTQIVSAYERYRPDVVLLDVVMPIMEGPEVCKILLSHYPDAHVIVLSSHSDHKNVSAMLNSGATSYMLKDALADDLLDTILVTHRGKTVLSPKVKEALISLEPSPQNTFGLTEREMDVIRLMGQSMNNRQIAAELRITYSTVSFHLENILTKMGVQTRSELLVVAAKHHII